MADSQLFGLYCTGGGAQGAYQVGVLKYIHEHFATDNQSPFQIFAGSSIGSINTTYCASMSFDAKGTTKEMESLWLDFDIPAWHGNLYLMLAKSFFRRWFTKNRNWSLLDPKPLHEIIQKSIRRENIESAFSAGTTRGIAVSTTEILSGKTCWFHEGPDAVNWHFLRSLARTVKIGGEHVEASCSAPLFFPPVKVGKHYFCDGAVSVKTPLNPIVNMGATRILCIASERPLPNRLPRYRKNFKPRFLHLYKMIDGQIAYNYSIEQAGTVKFINYFSERLKASNKGMEDTPDKHIFSEYGIYPANYQTTDVFLFFPSKRIRHNSVYPLGDELGGSKKTKFLFSKDFTKQLIEFGYQDAKVQHEALEQFFNPTPTRFISRFFRPRGDGRFEFPR